MRSVANDSDTGTLRLQLNGTTPALAGSRANVKCSTASVLDMRNPQQPIAIDRRYGKLTVARLLENGLVFCVCDCGSSREVKRERLTGGSVDCCQRCAKHNRSHLNRRNAEPPLPPAPEPPKPEPVNCNGKTVDGWLHCDASLLP